MESTQEFFDAQPLSPWIEDVNLLTASEARAEARFHAFLVSLNRPVPSPLALALVAVLAIPPVSRGIGK